MEQRSEAPGLRPVGAQLPSIAPLEANLESRESGSAPKPKSSETTGRPSPASEPASATGTQLSGIGCVRPPSSLREAEGVLANLTPLEIDNSLAAWLPSSVSCRVSEQFYRPRIDGPSDPKRNYEMLGWRLDDGWDEADGRESLRLLEMLNACATPEDCQNELARLKVLTVARNLSHDDLLAQIAIYAGELSQYPLDVVRDACRSWAKSEKWWPSWAELREQCDDRAMKRRGLLQVLKRYFEGTS